MFQGIKNYFNKVFWKMIYEGSFIHKIVYEESKPFEKIDIDFVDKEINESYRHDNNLWYHYNYIYLIKKKTTIEPSFGYLIYGFNKIIGASVFYKNLMPSLTMYFKYRLGTSKINKIKLEKSVVFDGNVGTNYFHFFSDVINKTWLFDKYGIDKSLPLIISESVFKTKYFQYFYNNTILKDRNWLVQNKNHWIISNETYVSRPMPYNKDLWFETLSILNIRNYCKSENYNRRVFLTRSKQSGRYISNFDEIQPILKKYNFEIVDTNNQSLENQIALFANIKYLVSIHGAGETNICFSYSNDLKFLEINPQNRISCHYFWLANVFGYSYNVIMGGMLESLEKHKEGGFYLSPEKLKSALEKMFKE